MLTSITKARDFEMRTPLLGAVGRWRPTLQRVAHKAREAIPKSCSGIQHRVPCFVASLPCFCSNNKNSPLTWACSCLMKRAEPLKELGDADFVLCFCPGLLEDSLGRFLLP